VFCCTQVIRWNSCARGDSNVIIVKHETQVQRSYIRNNEVRRMDAGNVGSGELNEEDQLQIDRVVFRTSNPAEHSRGRMWNT